MAPCLAAGKYLVITHLKSLLKLSRGGKKKRSRRKFLLIMSKKENADHFTIQKKNRYMQQGKETADTV